MLLELSCTACGKQLSVSDKLAGRKIKCPACEAVLTVPQAVEDDAYQLAESAPPPKPRPSKKGPSRPPCQNENQDQRLQNKPKLSRGMVKWLIFLGGGIVLGFCCLGFCGAGWLYFWHFPGSELVGTWETDPSVANDRYGQLRFDRFGHTTVVAPNQLGQTGTWRVLSKKDDTYTIQVTNLDGKKSMQMEITMITNDRIRLSIMKYSVELRRME
jgi:hypothetical protein